jgi:hypothetical protein
MKNMTTDFLTGTIKGPGELPREYLLTRRKKEKRADARSLPSNVGGLIKPIITQPYWLLLFCRAYSQ